MARFLIDTAVNTPASIAAGAAALWDSVGGGAGALVYFASTRRTVGQVQPEDLPLHVTDKQADRRHQRAMQRAMAHMLTLSPRLASIITIQNPPIV